MSPSELDDSKKISSGRQNLAGCRRPTATIPSGRSTPLLELTLPIVKSQPPPVARQPERGPAVLGLQEHLDVLSRTDYCGAEYAASIAAWPDARSIWPVLPPGEPKLQFVRYCLTAARLGLSPTGRIRPRAVETGAAAILFARASTRAKLSDAARRNLHVSHGVIGARMPPKLRLPLLLATTREHTFNAVYLGGQPPRVSSYLFIDSAEDEFVVPHSEVWNRRISSDWLDLSDIVDCDPRGELVTRHVHSLGAAPASKRRRMIGSTVDSGRGVAGRTSEVATPVDTVCDEEALGGVCVDAGEFASCDDDCT